MTEYEKLKESPDSFSNQFQILNTSNITIQTSFDIVTKSQKNKNKNRDQSILPSKKKTTISIQLIW